VLNPTTPPQWLPNTNIVERQQHASLIRYTALDTQNAWIPLYLGWQGSGRLTVEFQIRAQRSLELGTFLDQSIQGQVTQRTLRVCSVKTTWTPCQLELTLNQRALVSLGIGGSNTWKAGDTPLEVQTAQLQILEQATLAERFSTMARATGFAFNENAFAAQMLFVALLGWILSRGTWQYVVLLAGLGGILLSGSRASLLALVCALLVFWAMRSSYKIAKPLIGILVLGSLVGLFVVSLRQTGTAQSSVARSFYLTDQNATQDRLTLWRLASQAWLKNPSTILVGTGNLAFAMKAQYDTQAQDTGIAQDELTHAHNLLFQTAGESGLLGLLVIVWLWGWVVWRAWKSQDAGALALLAAIFVINSVDYLFYYSSVYLAFWMAAAGLKNPDNHKQLEPHPTTI
jgi:hypothetical protein